VKERNNFHEDDLRHYVLKAQNAREDGYTVGYAGYKRASKKTIKELLESGSLTADQRARYEAKVGGGPLANMLSKYDKATQEKLLAFMSS